MFDSNKFKTPEAVNTPGYFWLWNGTLEREKLFSQLEAMAASGAKSVCIHPMPPEFRATQMAAMSPDYLSCEFFRIYAEVTEKCAELGMNSYLYDEGGWPSGGACGRVLAASPEKFRRYILELDAAGEVVKTALPDNPYAVSMPDNMIPEATEKFLDLTHRTYKKYTGRHFGNTIRFAFTDEPQLGCCIPGKLPWTADIEEEFQRRKKYDIRPCYKDILSNPGPVPEANALRRLDYYDVYSQLFIERYLEPLQKCCHACGLLSAGHFSGEDEWFLPGLLTYGSIMPSLRALDVPGVDAIWRQIYPGTRLHPFPKLASSAARQTGSEYVMAELFSVYSNGLTPSEMFFIIDWMFFCGINIFVFAAYPYDTSNGNIEGCRPHNGKVNPFQDFISGLHHYTARLSTVGTATVPEVKTALFFDQRAQWMGGKTTEYAAANQLLLAEKLMDNLCDFDYIDDEVIAGGRAVDGKLVFGKAVYDHIIFPPAPCLSREAAENLENLRRSGVSILSADQWDKLPETLQTTAPAGKLRVRKMVSGNDTFYFVLNISSGSIEAEFTAAEKYKPVLCNSADGTFHKITGAADGNWKHIFPPRSSALFLLSGTPPEEVLPPLPRATEILAELTDSWEMAPVKQISVGENDFTVSYTAPVFRPAETGCWNSILGEDFSGQAVYRTFFDWQEEPSAAALLDLGKVNYAARVRLNGVEIGTTARPPHILYTGKALQKGRNCLEITVANTLANAIVPERILKKWTEELPYMTYYETIQRDFEKDSLESGLFGPVRIMKAETGE